MAYQIAVFSSHPIQYKVPLYRKLASADEIDVTVFFGARYGVEETDIGFGDQQSWDIPLLEGYDHEFLDNYAIVDEPSGMFSLINSGMFRRIDSRFDGLLVHAGYLRLSSLFALLAAWRSDVPVLLHGTGHRRDQPLLKRAVKQAYVRSFLRGVDVVLADCTANRRYYESFGVDSDDVYLVPTAIHNEWFRRRRDALGESDLAELRDELGVPPSHEVVLYVGKLIQRKRVSDLVEAFGSMSSEVESTLLVVGDGEERERLEQLCATEGIDDVVFAGFRGQEELPAFYELGDLFVLPSRYDPSPKVLNEAMNFELPVVTSDGVGSAEDLVRDNGRVYPVGDTGALADAISELLDDAELREEMGARSLLLVDEWDYEAGVRTIRTVLEELSGRED